MRKKIFIVTALVLAAAAGLAAAAVTQGAGRGYGRHNGWMLHRMTRELNLTDAQQAQIKTILQAQKTKMQPLMQQLRQNRLEEAGNVTANFDETQARAFAARQAQIMSDLTVERERTRSQIYAVLTPDQRTKALALMQERQQRRRHHGQKDSQPQAQQPPG